MATPRQKRAVKKILENPRMGVTTIMRMPEVGYSPKTVDPKILTESKGYKEELASYGLTPELITSTLVSDIQSLKPRERLGQLNLGADILNMKKESNITKDKTVVAIQVIVNGTNNIKNRTDGEAIVSP